MVFNSIANQGEYISSHYLAALLKNDLEGLRKRWRHAEKADTPSAAQGVKALGQKFFAPRNRITERLGEEPSTEALLDARIADQLRELNDSVLRALAYVEPAGSTATWLRRTELDVDQLGTHREVPVALAVTGPNGLELVALDATWAESAEGIVDELGGSTLLSPINLDSNETIEHAGKAIEFLFSCEEPARYVLLLAGNVLLLADRTSWPNSYLAINWSQALGAKDDKPGGELETIAALCGAESLLTFEGQTALADLVDKGRRHAVSVSKELREALRQSVELIAQEILDRIRAQGADPDDLGDGLARRLTEQSLRYLYRILFLLYAEARPELGILPGRDEAYQEGYGLARLGDIVSHDLPQESEHGLYFHQSLQLLFTLVDEGHRPQRAEESVFDEYGNEIALGQDGIRFEALKSDLFHPRSTSLIGEAVRVGQHTVDTRLRNKCLWQVVNLLMLTPESVKGRGRGRKQGQRGYISYATLGINQLGAVYEGLMSYTGFFAPERVYEVSKTVKSTGKTADGEDKEKADPSKGTWIVPVQRSGDYDSKFFVQRVDPITGESKPVIHEKGSFVYRLSGRERQRSASYYTPEVLTECTVKHALAELLSGETTSREILDLTVCEPALGSGAFLNEAINQLASEYMERAQAEQGTKLLPDQLEKEKQKVKAYLALHNCYGVDLNATAVELAEVSVWLNVMHEGLGAPWFGLHLRRGNSLIGARRAVYHQDQIKGGAWRSVAPRDRALACDEGGQGRVLDPIAEGEIHHFLLPSAGWGAVVEAAQARELVPEERAKLMAWRQAVRKVPNDKKTRDRLTALGQRVERLWELTRKRITVSEEQIRRDITVWGTGADGNGNRPLPKPASGAVTRDDIIRALYEDQESPYNRLKTIMNAWCALWFWPVGQGIEDIEPPTVEEWLSFCEAVLGLQPTRAGKAKGKYGRFDTGAGQDDVLGLFGTYDDFEQVAMEDEQDRALARCMVMKDIAIDERFGWWSVLTDIAEREGFFHWELEFAQVFAKGGFDLQVGNPPWVRLDWKDEPSLAESDPWFMLQDHIPEMVLKERRREVLDDASSREAYLFDLTSWAGLSEYLGSAVEHPVLAGIRTNLYINFMERAWRNLGDHGITGLIHYEQHFVDAAGAVLRSRVYPRLRRHFQFGNNLLLFEDVDNNKNFGINIYGKPRDISFIQMARLVHPSIIDDSLNHGGSGEVPGIQYPYGGWDKRPHAARVISVTAEVLADWAAFADPEGTPVNQARGLRPLTSYDNEAVRTIGRFGERLADNVHYVSQGLNEKNAKRDSMMEAWSGFPDSWQDAILQGPHFSVATPFAKEPNPNCRSNKDYSDWDLVDLPQSVIPRVNYKRSCDVSDFLSGQRLWAGKRSTDYWRLAWRRRVVAGTERTLQTALLFPGPTHVDTVHTLALENARKTAALAGMWASLPLDFICRISGKDDIRGELASQFPAPLTHPLTTPLILRTLRLNCLTRDYAPLWEELFDETWRHERWTDPSKERKALQAITPDWTMDTPLRTDYDRRMALVEIDAMVALMLGLTAEQLCALYRTQFAVLRKYEWEMFFAPDGHKIGAETHNRGARQTDDETAVVRAWKKAQLTDAPEPEIPEGWVKPDREAEMTHAYEEFQRRLDAGEYLEVSE